MQLGKKKKSESYPTNIHNSADYFKIKVNISFAHKEVIYTIKLKQLAFLLNKSSLHNYDNQWLHF